MPREAASLIYPQPDSASARLFARAGKALPGGNSRHSVAMAPYPIYAARGKGCFVTDVDGNLYIDCINNMSAAIHGHGHPAVMAAVQRQMEQLVSVGLPTLAEIELAELLIARVPSVERVRFANSGSEALMFAIRVARAFTGRQKIAKIEGGYHGSHDSLDVSNKPTPDRWGPADAPFTVTESAGLSAGAVRDTIVLPANRIEATRVLLEAHGDDLAAVVTDPLISRMGFLPLTADYLAMLREETARRCILLVFDEVFSFRLGLAGAQGLVGIRPDLSTFGKIIGGGFPIGAVGGRADIMDRFNHLPSGHPPVEHSGTFNANPVSMAAGKAALELLDAAEFERLARLGDRLRQGMDSILRALGAPGRAQGLGSLTALILHDRPVSDYRDFFTALVETDAIARMSAFHREMLNRGVLTIFPGGFVLSTPMDEAIVEQILEAAHASLETVFADRLAPAS